MAVNNVNIKVNAYGDFSQIQTAIARLETAARNLNAHFAGVGIPSQVIKDVGLLQRSFEQALVSTGKFTVQQVRLSDATERLSRNLAQGKLHLSEYWNLYKSGTRGTSKELNAVAEQQARLLSRTTSFLTPMKQGYATFITDLNSTVDKTVQAQQYQKLWNTTLRDGANKLIDFGKNTQWAGRQLTVGLTVPLTIFGKTAAQIFIDVDKQLTRLQKVYGTGLTAPTEQAIASIRKQVLGLSTDLAKQYGVAASQTAATAADLAATGLEGNDLIESTRQTTRLATLGELDHQQAMKATIALQRTFKLNTSQLGDAVNFLNAVENQTSTSLQDLVDGLPRAGNVVENLGGSFKDLAAMMVAMREAGVPAGEAANSIKSALASLINPSRRATEDFGKMGINLKAIVTNNRGNVLGMIRDLQTALEGVGGKNPQARIQLIEELFGKFQYNKVTTLLNNLGKAGSQTQQVFELALSTNKDLASLADRELKTLSETGSGKYQRAVEGIKADLIPIGDKFLNIASKVINFFDKIVQFANKFGPLSNVLFSVLGGAALVGPLVMVTGLLGNFVGNVFKGVNYLKMFNEGLRQTGSFKGALSYLRNFFEEVDISILAGANASDRFTGALEKQTQAFAGLEMYLNRYATSLESIIGMQTAAATGVLPAGTAGGGVVPSNAKGLTYSHYVPGSKLGETSSSAQRSHLIGSYLTSDLAEINTGVSNRFYTQFGLTSEEQKGKLVEYLGKKPSGSGRQYEEDLAAYEARVAKIKAMTDAELKLFFPALETILSQNLKYAMTLESAAATKTNRETTAALAEFKSILRKKDATDAEIIAAAERFYNVQIGIDKKLESSYNEAAEAARASGVKTTAEAEALMARILLAENNFSQAFLKTRLQLYGRANNANEGAIRNLSLAITRGATILTPAVAEVKASADKLIIATEESLLASARALNAGAAAAGGGAAAGAAGEAGKKGIFSRMFKPSMKGLGIGLGVQLLGDLALSAYNPGEGSTGAATKSGLSTALGVGGTAAMFLAPEVAIPLALGAGLFSFMTNKNKGKGPQQNALASQISSQTFQSNEFEKLQGMISGGMQGLTPVGTNIYQQKASIENQIDAAKNVIKQEKQKIKQNDIIIKQHERNIQLRDEEFRKQEQAIKDAQELSDLNQNVIKAKAGGNLIDIAMAETARIAGQSEIQRRSAKEAADEKDRTVINSLTAVNTTLEQAITNQDATLNKLNTKLENIATQIESGVSQGVAPVGDALSNLQKLQTAVSMGALNPEEIQKFAKGGKINDKLITSYLKSLGISGIDDAMITQIAKIASYGYNANAQHPTLSGPVQESLNPLGHETVGDWAKKQPKQPKQTYLSSAKAYGGYISGPGGPTSDSIPAMLSNGEYVVRASSVAKYGTKFMDSVNSGMYGFSIGGMALNSIMPNYSVPGGAKYANGGLVNNSSYNVSIVVNGSDGTSANEIARAVKREFDKLTSKSQSMYTSRVVTA